MSEFLKYNIKRILWPSLFNPFPTAKTALERSFPLKLSIITMENIIKLTSTT